jgi:hypothetical protein
MNSPAADWRADLDAAPLVEGVFKGFVEGSGAALAVPGFTSGGGGL